MKNSPLIYLVVLLLLFGTIACGTASNSSTETENSSEKFGGLALYTVRDSMAKDPLATLKVVSESGYAYVEAADYAEGKFYGMSPEVFKSTLDSLGLQAMSAHMGMVTLENADQLIADVKAAGITYFVIPVPPMGMFTVEPATPPIGLKDKVLTPLRSGASLKSTVPVVADVGFICKIVTVTPVVNTPAELVTIIPSNKSNMSPVPDDMFEIFIVTGKQIGRASCRERVCQYV